MSDTTRPEFETNEAAGTAETDVLPDLPTAGDVTEEFPSVTGSLGPGSMEPLRDSPGSTARVRWAGILWGTIFAAIGLATALIVTSPDRRDAFGGWLGTLTPGGFVLVGVLTLGCLILVLGLLAAVRRLQRRRVAS